MGTSFPNFSARRLRSVRSGSPAQRTERGEAMPANKCSLANAVKELKRVLAEDAAGREKDWTGRMGQALSALEQSVRQHRAKLEDAEGRVVEVESSLTPSPTVARRADQLREELDRLLQDAHALRGKLQSTHPSRAR